MLSRSDFRFHHRLRVQADSLGLMGQWPASRWLAALEEAVSEYRRRLGLSFPDHLQLWQGRNEQQRTQLEVVGQVHRDDLLEVGLRMQPDAQGRVKLVAAVFRQEDTVARLEQWWQWLDQPAGGATSAGPMPAALIQLIQAFETGEAMHTVKVGRWSELSSAAGSVRRQVFVEEQGIPEDLEWDDADADCLHAVAFNRMGEPLATGRLLEHVPGVAKIGRMAVVRSARGTRVGRAVLDALMDAARARGDGEVLLHAQTAAAGFYARAGFQTRGSVFHEVDIPHIEMVKAF
jgi:predicted GNAT family N-acyltransferase/acyl-CoA thioesterase FadM